MTEEPQQGYTWMLCTLDGKDEGDLVAEKLLVNMSAKDILDTIFASKPELWGKSFVVNDDDTERAYIIWEPSEGIYDEYVHTGWTSDYKIWMEKFTKTGNRINVVIQNE